MTLSLDRNIIYPDSDGQPMADNTQQFRWIVLIKENLECLFAQNAEVFVAGDLLWYPVEGRPDIRVAPDVFVVFGRPKGDRGSYRQWVEENIAPQVVFEILSPGNTFKEMTKKLQFYERYGVEEYYIYDPDRNHLTGLQRQEGNLTFLENVSDWTSPRLGIRFVLEADTLAIYYPDGQRFLTTVELTQRAEQEKQRAEQEKQRAEQEKQRADSAEVEIARLKKLLQQAGINADEVK
ncbi:Uma2 family endonuclease [Planktothricoides raciborskii]|uniref:Uma2 family endonuclease n=1 Tax=Planktothricoides raciborskii GIHE-MW2 TaxID=2792601 RepID=A0AAU8J962_9CYAN